MHAKNIALVLFGGSGERFGGKVPKQFAFITDKPMMIETLSRIASSSSVEEIYVVTRKVDQALTAGLIEKYRLPKIKGILVGGKTREESVYKGLKHLHSIGTSARSLILIHDGDRPNIDKSMIEENFKQAYLHGGAVTAIPSNSSVFVSPLGLEVERYLPRNEIYLAQTPQTFRYGPLKKAFDKVHRKHRLDEFTDDASIYRSLKHKVAIVLGEAGNVKITTKSDLALFYEGRRNNE